MYVTTDLPFSDDFKFLLTSPYTWEHLLPSTPVLHKRMSCFCCNCDACFCKIVSLSSPIPSCRQQYYQFSSKMRGLECIEEGLFRRGSGKLRCLLSSPYRSTGVVHTSMTEYASMQRTQSCCKNNVIADVHFWLAAEGLRAGDDAVNSFHQWVPFHYKINLQVERKVQTWCCWHNITSQCRGSLSVGEGATKIDSVGTENVLQTSHYQALHRTLFLHTNTRVTSKFDHTQSHSKQCSTPTTHDTTRVQEMAQANSQRKPARKAFLVSPPQI